MAKRKPLVSQHLENISREGLEEYQGGDLVSLNELRKWFLGKKQQEEADGHCLF